MGLLTKNQDLSPADGKMSQIIPGSFSLFPAHLPQPSALHTQCRCFFLSLQTAGERALSYSNSWRHVIGMTKTKVCSSCMWPEPSRKSAGRYWGQEMSFIFASFLSHVFLNRTALFTYGVELPSKLSPKPDYDYFKSYCWFVQSTQFSSKGNQEKSSNLYDLHLGTS